MVYKDIVVRPASVGLMVGWLCYLWIFPISDHICHIAMYDCKENILPFRGKYGQNTNDLLKKSNLSLQALYLLRIKFCYFSNWEEQKVERYKRQQNKSMLQLRRKIIMNCFWILRLKTDSKDNERYWLSWAKMLTVTAIT